MTWLSRLRPTDRKISQRASNRRRRMATLDFLEDRTLLSNVVTSITHASNGAITLNILGDTHSDSFGITENANGTVTVTGTGRTQINGSPLGVAFTTTQPISNIGVTLPGSGVDIDHVSLTGHGTVQNVSITVPGVSPTTAATCLFLTVTNTNNAGSLTVNDAPYSSASGAVNNSGGQLTATVTGSHFTALTIEQDGCCPANYTLDHDTVPGAVTLEQGTANGNSVTVTNDTFGATTITQFFAPSVTMGGGNSDSCTGQGDTVTVDDSQIFSLAVYQNGRANPSNGHNGGGMTIDIGTTSDVEVALTGFGVIAEQPYASGGDTIHIESITQYGRAPNSWVHGPPSIYTLQGDGGGETTTVDSSVVFGNISIYQGNGAGDQVFVGNDEAGYTLAVGPFIEDFFGDLTIVQGNGFADTVTINSVGSEPPLNAADVNIFNNVYISQGNGTVGAPGDPCCGGQPGGDTVNLDESVITSDLFIFQNAYINSDGLATGTLYNASGNNTINIALNEQVLVGNQTFLYQGGSNNTVNLGGAGDPSGIDFETTYLDIWTGWGGGGFVSAANTVVDVGSFFGNNWTINGAGDGNTFEDLGGNINVTYGPGYTG